MSISQYYFGGLGGVDYRKIKGTKCALNGTQIALREIGSTGNPGSVRVPQYGSSKITVFVWGKNTILTFAGNTKYKSMKLTLQLVVVSLLLQRSIVIICSNSLYIQL